MPLARCPRPVESSAESACLALLLLRPECALLDICPRARRTVRTRTIYMHSEVIVPYGKSLMLSDAVP